ncbi:MAG: hypothetical protein JW784_07030 [Candidatus Cloacimonetes bacterium]|nr:hypothetical protein [Candidatus Cloacimonadota bacterium]
MFKNYLLLFTMVISINLSAQGIYIWHNENPSFAFLDPETDIPVGGDYAIINGLDYWGYDFTIGSTLPADLTTFDAIFILLGSFCEG